MKKRCIVKGPQHEILKFTSLMQAPLIGLFLPWLSWIDLKPAYSSITPPLRIHPDSFINFIGSIVHRHSQVNRDWRNSGTAFSITFVT